MHRKPGWYDDPREGLRYWDGYRWANIRNPDARYSVWSWLWIAVGLVLGVLLLIAL